MKASLRLLGLLAVTRGGRSIELPASRKVRALIGYLAVAPRPLTRAHLCELLWEVPNDPRSELRWCLSKMRAVLDDSDRKRVKTAGETVSLDLEDCSVDALEVNQAIQVGLATLPVPRLRELSLLCRGEFLETLEVDNSPQFGAWLVAQRHRFQACLIAVLEQLVKCLPEGSADAISVLEQWLALAPLDRRAHELLFACFARDGRVREGAERLDAAVTLFEAEGLDPAPLRAAWSAATRSSRPTLVSVHDSMPAAPVSNPSPARRASIAVMPLADVSAPEEKAGNLASALIHDVITRLAKLRSVAVIAQGTVFALSERGTGPEAAGRMLNVDYVASGSLRKQGKRLTVMVELAETRTAHIVWADDFNSSLDDALLVLDEMGNRIVAAIASEIEVAERNRALLKPPSSLDAWEAYHRGLWHMYRFDQRDNEQAAHFFNMAVRLDPTFSRAHAGLSFTHFQNAFLYRREESQREIDRALACATQGLIIDERDPTAHFAMGRALWLQGRSEEGLQALDRSIELSPNYALGHYASSFIQSQSGDPRRAIVASDHSRNLSPFDPLLFAMLASRAMAHLRLGQPEEAAHWAMNAAARPNAHVHVKAIAAQCLAAASRLDEAKAVLSAIHRLQPGYDMQAFQSAFRFDRDTAELWNRHGRRIGLK